GSKFYVIEDLIEEAGIVLGVVAEVRARLLAALTLFARGRYVAESAVRAAYCKVFDSLLTELEDAERPGDRSMFDALDRYARRMARRSAGSSAERVRQWLRATGAEARLSDVNFLNLSLALTGRVSRASGFKTLVIVLGLDAMTRESLSGA